MLHIILFILKILGYMLLTVLGLLLLVLLITLFVPVKYQFFGSYMEKPDLSAKITWLFGLIKANAEFHDKHFRLYIKIAWKTLFDTNGQKKEDQVSDRGPSCRTDEKHKTLKKEEKEQTDSKDTSFNHSTSEKMTMDVKQGQSEIIQDQSETQKADLLQSASEVLPESNQENAGSNKRIKKLFSRKKNSDSKTKKEISKGEKKNIFETIALKIEGFLEKVDLLSEKAEEKMDALSCKLHNIEKFLSAECTKNSIALMVKMLKSILKHVAPKDVSGRIHFGMDKPSTTGKVLGYASAFYPLYANKVQLEPDFEQSVIEGHMDICGGIRLYIFVFWALRMILCKDIRKLIKYMKHLKK